MNRVTKWVVRGLLGLVGLLVIAVILVYALSSRRMNKVYTVNEPALTIPTDSASIAKGQHFVQAIGKCATCHGDDFAGKVLIEDPLIGRMYTANLTRGNGGIGASYTDADYVRAIRHGIKKNGHPMLFMHSTTTAWQTISTRWPQYSRDIISVALRSLRMTSHQLSPPGGR